MNVHHTNRYPQDIRRQTSLVARYLYDCLSESVIGVYVHGSVCLNAYIPGRSDLDMLIVIDRPLVAEERFRLMQAFLAMHRQPAPIEASIVLWSDMEQWTHPAPYQFHFSEFWRKRYEAVEAREDVGFWRFDGARTDRDLACHVKLTRERGIAVFGPPASGILPIVPEAHVLDSIRADAGEWHVREKNAADRISDNRSPDASDLLQLARVWSYSKLNRIISKAAAAAWAIGELPDETWKAIMRSVLEAHESGRHPLSAESPQHRRLAAYISEQISACSDLPATSIALGGLRYPADRRS